MEINSNEFVLFGASGDLAREKLFPALFSLFTAGKQSRFIGYARTDMTTTSFRDIVRESVAKKMKDIDSQKIEEFVSAWDYVSGSYDEEGIAALPKKTKGTYRYYYLSIPISQELISDICEGLSSGGHIDGKSLIVLEKPFGSDRKSAGKLNSVLKKYFKEEQIYRIDHYLAKDLVQDLLALRFANPIFENIWNSKFIESIDIEIKESDGIRSRGQYYDKAGAIRDMIQNHALQLLAFAVMDQPKDLSAASIHKEKIKTIKKLKLFNYAGKKPVSIGQYKGYRQEPYVAKDSFIETKATIIVEVDAPKWRKVPISITTGKKMDLKTTDIIVRFRKTGHSLWEKSGCEIEGNEIRINVQPNNDISLRLNSEFNPEQKCAFPTLLKFGFADNKFLLKESYENALRDMFNHDRSIFISSEEIMAAWKFIDDIMERIDANRSKILETY